MRLIKARVQKYRSIHDSGYFDVEELKTIMVGPNEAGKTALLQALQHLKPPVGIKPLNPLRDFPRAEYNDITTGKVNPAEVKIVEGHFKLEPADVAAIGPEYADAVYIRGKRLDNSEWHFLEGGPEIPRYKDVEKDLARLASHVDKTEAKEKGEEAIGVGATAIAELTKGWGDEFPINSKRGEALSKWLKDVFPFIEEETAAEEERHDRLAEAVKISAKKDAARDVIAERMPVFVLFSNYFRVRPIIHLEHLAQRVESKVLDDDQYDYGNLCLLKLLGFTASELSKLGSVATPDPNSSSAMEKYREQLDKRQYQLNAASVQLTSEIRSVWQPVASRGEADKLKFVADGQYLKVVVEDELGVEIELDQRSEGFQWLVSFFVVFFAEAMAKHQNAVLLLDEPGLSLHGLKQREFRETLSRLSLKNQTIFTTHSPFLVGPGELDLVRVIEMPDRAQGTQVHNGVLSTDPGALLPLQEALGYDLAQSLFTQQRNLVLEGLTDFWYVDSVAQLMRDAGEVSLNEKIALVPAQTAGKVVYYATILHSNKLKVAALLDSDAAGDQAAKQDSLVHQLGSKGIIRSKDAYAGPVTKPEVEDLLRATLIKVAASELGWEVAAEASAKPAVPIVNIFEASIPDFKKYRLAKAFIKWTRSASIADFEPAEIIGWKRLFELINRALK